MNACLRQKYEFWIVLSKRVLLVSRFTLCYLLLQVCHLVDETPRMSRRGRCIGRYGCVYKFMV